MWLKLIAQTSPLEVLPIYDPGPLVFDVFLLENVSDEIKIYLLTSESGIKTTVSSKILDITKIGALEY